MRRSMEVILVAENRLLRESLVRLLSKKSELRLVGSHPYSACVHEVIVAASPHILVLDSFGLHSSNSALLATVQETLPDLRIIMVDMDSDPGTFFRAVRAGVVGYVLKDASALEVASTIRAVAAGSAVCPPCLSMSMFRLVAQASVPTTDTAINFRLSRREQQTMELLRECLTNKEIGARLGLSEQTVKNHIHSILRKVGVKNRMSIIRRYQSRQPAKVTLSDERQPQAN
jgi:DNA-binding NarL/FixJ family response regulator